MRPKTHSRFITGNFLLFQVQAEPSPSCRFCGDCVVTFFCTGGEPFQGLATTISPRDESGMAKAAAPQLSLGGGLRENKRKTQTKKKRLSAEETTLCDANDGTCACGPESLKSARPDQLLDG